MATNRSRLRRVLKSFLINKLIITYILRVLISLLRILFLIYNFVGFIIETELIKTESEFFKTESEPAVTVLDFKNRGYMVTVSVLSWNRAEPGLL